MYDDLSFSCFYIYYLRLLLTHVKLQGMEKISEKNDTCCLICTKEFDIVRQCHDYYKICKSSLKCTKCDQIFDKLCTYH